MDVINHPFLFHSNRSPSNNKRAADTKAILSKLLKFRLVESVESNDKPRSASVHVVVLSWPARLEVHAVSFTAQEHGFKKTLERYLMEIDQDRIIQTAMTKRLELTAMASTTASCKISQRRLSRLKQPLSEVIIRSSQFVKDSFRTHIHFARMDAKTFGASGLVQVGGY